METNGHRAWPSATIESQPNLSDGRDPVGHRPRHLDNHTAGPFDVDGTELMVERAAFLELSFVQVDFRGMVKNVSLIASTDKLEFAGHQK